MVKKYNFGHFEPQKPKNREKTANLRNFQFFELKSRPQKVYEKSLKVPINKAVLSKTDKFRERKNRLKSRISCVIRVGWRKTQGNRVELSENQKW